MTEDFDVLILGSGPAGFYAALTCARGGLKTVLVEKSDWGGTGFATGCLPVKLLFDRIRTIRQSENFRGIRRDESLSQLKGVLPDFREHLKHSSHLNRRRLTEAGVRVYHSDGYFTDSHSYKTDRAVLKAEKIIIATGSEPVCIEGSVFSGRIISHKEAVLFDNPPEKLTIIGGDVEGIEFASLFSQLGTKVTVIEKLPEILPGYSRELVEPVREALLQKKVETLCSTEVTSLFETEVGVIINTETGEISSEMVLVTGLRKSSFPGGLKELGLKTENDFISVDENFESSVPGIFAIGDINGILGMAGAAIQQAVQLSDYLSVEIKPELDYSILPRAVFTIPQICGGGLQLKDIGESRGEYSVKTIAINSSWRSMYKKGADDSVTIISDGGNIIRGIWFVGENVEIHGSAAALILKNETSLSELRRSLYIHPTEFETLFEAVIL